MSTSVYFLVWLHLLTKCSLLVSKDNVMRVNTSHLSRSPCRTSIAFYECKVVKEMELWEMTYELKLFAYCSKNYTSSIGIEVYMHHVREKA